MTFPSTRQHFQSLVLKNANRQSSQIPLSTFMLSKNKILTHIRVAIISIVEMILVDFRFDFFLSFDSYIVSFFYFLDSLFIWKCLSQQNNYITEIPSCHPPERSPDPHSCCIQLLEFEIGTDQRSRTRWKRAVSGNGLDPVNSLRTHRDPASYRSALPGSFLFHQWSVSLFRAHSYPTNRIGPRIEKENEPSSQSHQHPSQQHLLQAFNFLCMAITSEIKV